MLVLEPEQFLEVQSILRAHLPTDTSIVAYGSRVVAPHTPSRVKPFSDLDLALQGKPLSLAIMSTLREAFSESNLPFRTDICHITDLPITWLKNLQTEPISANKRCTKVNIQPLVR